MNLASTARVLGGVVCGHRVLAPGPGHSKQDRSLAVFINPNSPDLFRVHSHAGDDWRVCRDHVKARLGISNPVPGYTRQRVEVPPRPQVEPVPIDDMARTLKAITIWGESRSLDGTPALTYLVKRGIDIGRLPHEIHRALRWHPSCPWEQGRHGALVALMTDAITGDAKAIHRTAITATGLKGGKKMLGPSAGCVVRLWTDESVTTGLVLGEGIETTLAAATRVKHRGTRLAPAWAACSAGGMAKFPVLAGVECITLLVDNDESGAGQRAAAECSARWTAAGRDVFRLMPNVTGQDFADLGKAA